MTAKDGEIIFGSHSLVSDDRSCVMLPLTNGTGKSNFVGILIAGVNPYQALDSEYW